MSSETETLVRLFPEDKSNTAYGVDEGGRIIQLDFLTQVADIDVEKIVVPIKIFSPNTVHDFPAFKHAACAPHQEIQQVVFLHRQSDRTISPHHIPGTRVHAEVGDLENFVDV